MLHLLGRRADQCPVAHVGLLVLSGEHKVANRIAEGAEDCGRGVCEIVQQLFKPPVLHRLVPIDNQPYSSEVLLGQQVVPPLAALVVGRRQEFSLQLLYEVLHPNAAQLSGSAERKNRRHDKQAGLVGIVRAPRMVRQLLMQEKLRPHHLPPLEVLACYAIENVESKLATRLAQFPDRLELVQIKLVPGHLAASLRLRTDGRARRTESHPATT
mmetsp:Transcript_7811/g.22239  ORF Transcript_7811/g.22239 Transcript_7811/m.22239 type:complete len:213 (-) Transcript_7811:689-1327(-)